MIERGRRLMEQCVVELRQHESRLSACEHDAHDCPRTSELMRCTSSLRGIARIFAAARSSMGSAYSTGPLVQVLEQVRAGCCRRSRNALPIEHRLQGVVGFDASPPRRVDAGAVTFDERRSRGRTQEVERHVDAERLELGVETFAEDPFERLGGRVHRHEAAADERGHRGNQHDPAPSASRHSPPELVAQHRRCRAVGRDVEDVVLERALVERAHAFSGGVVDEEPDVEPVDEVEQSRRGARITDVSGERPYRRHPCVLATPPPTLGAVPRASRSGRCRARGQPTLSRMLPRARSTRRRQAPRPRTDRRSASSSSPRAESAADS